MAFVAKREKGRKRVQSRGVEGGRGDNMLAGLAGLSRRINMQMALGCVA